MKTFYLIDYKGKFDIACDKLDDEDVVVGKISEEDLIIQAENRKANARYYGVPVYIGKDKKLNKILNE